MRKARILLSDDHAIVLEGTKGILAEFFSIVGTASDGRSLVEEALRIRPDVILLDISMPLLNGIEAAVRIKKSLPEVKLVFFTMHSERLYVQAAFESGAAAYVLKSAECGELVGAIERALAGQTYVSSDLVGYSGHLPGPNQIAKSLRLSPREREILQLIAEGRSGKEIAAILGVSVRTVSFHRENIKRKLSVKSTAELTRNAIAGDVI